MKAFNRWNRVLRLNDPFCERRTLATVNSDSFKMSKPKKVSTEEELNELVGKKKEFSNDISIDLGESNSLNCRHLKTRNNSYLYILSPKDCMNSNSQDVFNALKKIQPDGIAMGICLKRFKYFYNFKNTVKPPTLSSYISEYFSYGLCHTYLHFTFNRKFLGNINLFEKTSIVNLHMPVIDYLNDKDTSSKVIVKYADMHFRDVLNNVAVLTPIYFKSVWNYYLGFTTKNLTDNIIKSEKFHRLFLVHRANNLIHYTRKLSSEIKLSPSNSTVEPKIVLVCEEWESQYIAENWDEFFVKLLPIEHASYVPIWMTIARFASQFFIIIFIVLFLRGKLNDALKTH